MSLSPEDRLQFVQWMGDLGPDCDRSRILHFINARKEEAKSELVEMPGYEQARAGLLRLLPDLVPQELARMELLQKIGPAITAPTVPTDTSPAGVFSRHPAWVGLSVLEYCEQIQRPDGGLEWAVELAGQAFLVQGGHHGVGRGEVLWAMAEQAEEVDWLDRTSVLLEEAAKGPFAEEGHKEQVALLVALRRLENDPQTGEEILDVILESKEVDEQTFVHAAWIKAHLLKEKGETELATNWITRSLEAVDEQSSKVENRLRAFLSELQG